MSSLLQLGMFGLASGRPSAYKIECDAMTDGDWEAAAYLVAHRVPAFSYVMGVPTGGYKLARELRKYQTHGADTWLLVDDVWTTGGSMWKARRTAHLEGQNVVGAVLFARNVPEDWVVPVFQMTEPLQ